MTRFYEKVRVLKRQRIKNPAGHAGAERWLDYLRRKAGGDDSIEKSCALNATRQYCPAVFGCGGARRCLAHYVSSKGGLIGLTRALARELGEHEIRVNTVTPGFTMSDGSRQLFRDAGLPEGDPTINERSIKREQQPEDVVGAVLFLVADDSRFVTGQIINVDGGWLAH